MDAANLVPLPVLLPLIGAGVALCFPRSPRVQRIVSATSLSAVLVVAAFLVAFSTTGPQVLWVGAWPEGLGIVLVADRLSALMVLVSSIVTITVLVFATRQDQDAGTTEAPVSIFHPTYLVLSAGVANAFLAGDLFNLFVGFEILLFASYVLLTLGAPRERVRAGSTYIVVSIVSSTLFLLAIAIVYAAVGTVNFAQMSERLGELGEGLQLTIQLLLLTVFAVKAAIFPLSSWLPDSYPTAPASVTAVFAGLLTKVGVYAIIRLQTLFFPDSPLTDLLLWAALATMVVGILGALAQNEIKRLLSFTLVSHIGYMVLGIGLATEAGMAGAIFYVAHHILIQTALFLVVGLIERAGGSTSMSKIGGLASIPVLAVLFFVPAINLAGLPPFSGFLGKVALIQAGIDVGTPLAYALVFGGIAVSLLTLLAIIRVWHRAFWEPAREQDAKHRRLPASWLVTAGALVAVTCAITVVAGPLSSFATDAAHDLRDGAYVEAVEEAIP
ncbi:Na+/H+ antiporter subunit D [Agrococcus versicolor]|uniref:Na+/H+ antiporter subunit D n=1 Tax=Agrococcus versicolor TaxID=501482 RepID=A0ABN3ALZ8_9MICO